MVLYNSCHVHWATSDSGDRMAVQHPQERIRTGDYRVRACNCVKIETGQISRQY